MMPKPVSLLLLTFVFARQQCCFVRTLGSMLAVTKSTRFSKPVPICYAQPICHVQQNHDFCVMRAFTPYTNPVYHSRH